MTPEGAESTKRAYGEEVERRERERKRVLLAALKRLPTF